MGLVSGYLCDFCGCRALYDYILPQKTLIRLLRGVGWPYGKYVLCPRCRSKKKGVSE